jgi:hypothetical protein
MSEIILPQEFCIVLHVDLWAACLFEDAKQALVPVGYSISNI